MKVSDFPEWCNEQREQHNLWHKWLRLIESYRYDATVELSRLYRQLVPDAPPLDKDVRSDDHGILHSNTHVYIYRFTQWERCNICYGNDGKIWPITDQSLWPWTVARKAVPWMNRDVWNLIFHRLAPYDILSLRQVCRQLREYVHDPRAWKHFDGLSTDWRFYQNLLNCKNRTIIIPHFLRIICVPHGFGGGIVSRGKGDDYYIGDIEFKRAYKKRNYVFSTNNRTVFYFRHISCSVDGIRDALLTFLKFCRNNWRLYSSQNSPLVHTYLFTRPSSQ